MKNKKGKGAPSTTAPAPILSAEKSPVTSFEETAKLKSQPDLVARTISILSLLVTLSVGSFNACEQRQTRKLNLPLLTTDVSLYEPLKADSKPKLRVTVTNNGKSEAKKVKILWEWIYIPDKVTPLTASFNKDSALLLPGKEHHEIYPGAPQTHELQDTAPMKVLTQTDIDHLSKSQSRFYLGGTIFYSDVYGSNHSHRFCHSFNQAVHERHDRLLPFCSEGYNYTE